MEFIIRPELNNASPEDYENLHNEMYNRKIYRVIKSSANIWYDLPTGTYTNETFQTLEVAFTTAKAAIHAIGKKNNEARRDYELIVTGKAGSQLDLVKNSDLSKRPR